MLRHFENTIGFSTEAFVNQQKLKIGLIDADLLDHGTRHPNLALEKISGYCKSLGHDVHLLCSYEELKFDNPLLLDDQDFDILCLSQVFKFTKRPKEIDILIENGFIIYGGTGFFEINGPNLPNEVEHIKPDYHLYDEYINLKTAGDAEKKKRDWDDYLSFSIGFTTRGCIRHCGFCVNRLLNHVEQWSPVNEFLDESRPRIYLWDDNIMAAPARVFSQVIDSLKATKKAFQFRQGLDIRLMTEQKAQLLNEVKYYGDFIFAFDHYRLDEPNEKKNVDQTIKGLKTWRRNCLKSTKLYVLVAYDSIDEHDVEGAFWRIKVLMQYGCLPYIMRYERYKDSRFKNIYTQLARWCNQPSFFKKMSFRQYCIRNEEYHQGIQNNNPKGVYNTKLVFPKNFNRKQNYCLCYQSMIDFEDEFPDIANKYFDLRFEEINPYRISK